MIASKVIDYRNLISRLTDGFVGRSWVRDVVDEFLHADGPRHFLLLGEPGCGKTAFLADLVHHYAEGLRASDETLLRAKSLPQGLYGIYVYFLARIKELREQAVPWTTVYKPVLAALSVACEPLTQSQLAAFTEVERGVVASVLVGVKQLLEVLSKGGHDRYVLYHPSFGEFLTSERNEDHIDGPNMHWNVARHYLHTWGGLENGLLWLTGPRDRVQGLPAPGSGPVEMYALHHLVTHLLNAGSGKGGMVLDHLVKLIATRFLDVKVSEVGALEAATDARRIAVALAGAGEERWDDLVLCAGKYCAVAEILRGEAGSLEEMVQDEGNQRKRVLELIETERHAFWRGIFFLAASTFLAKKREREQAAELWDRGIPLVQSQLAAGSVTTEDIGLPLMLLIKGLLKGSLKGVDNSGGKPRPAEPRPASTEPAPVSPLFSISALDTPLTYLSIRFVCFLLLLVSGGLAFCLLSLPGGPPLVRTCASPLLCLSACLGLFLLMDCVWRRRKRRKQMMSVPARKRIPVFCIVLAYLSTWKLLWFSLGLFLWSLLINILTTPAPAPVRHLARVLPVASFALCLITPIGWLLMMRMRPQVRRIMAALT
ncbi:MAG TPA: hypothetical protein VH682_23460 [Gemmataceae bacterium]|jgi:hypothetical protein